MIRDLFLIGLTLTCVSCTGGGRRDQTPPPEVAETVKPKAKSKSSKPEPAREFPRDIEGKRISEVAIRYTNATSVDPVRLRNYISSHAGDRYDSRKVDDDIKRLYESGLVDDVRVLAEPEGADLRVIFEATLRGFTWNLPFPGANAFSQERLVQESRLPFGREASRMRLSAPRVA